MTSDFGPRICLLLYTNIIFKKKSRKLGPRGPKFNDRHRNQHQGARNSMTVTGINTRGPVLEIDSQKGGPARPPHVRVLVLRESMLQLDCGFSLRHEWYAGPGFGFEIRHQRCKIQRSSRKKTPPGPTRRTMFERATPRVQNPTVVTKRRHPQAPSTVLMFGEATPLGGPVPFCFVCVHRVVE